MDFALICLAMASSNCGEIIRSFWATTYQEGFDFQAAVVTLPPRAAPEVGCCVAMRRSFSALDRSWAKSSEIPLAVKDRKPEESGLSWLSPGGVGNSLPRS